MDYTILVYQIILFLILWAILSKILFHPYLALLDERERKTAGTLREAADLEREGERLRAEYEEKSLSRTKPWVAEGICRRTWERRRNECRKSGGNKVTYRDYPLATSEQGGESEEGVCRARSRAATAANPPLDTE